MKVSDRKTVESYAVQHSQMIAMLENLQEFVNSMPAPDENGEIHGVDYGYTGSVGMIHEHLKSASDIAYEMSE